MLKQTAITGALLLALCLSTPAAAHFGPEPDDRFVAAARQEVIDRREELGDEAFATEAIANLELILKSLPYNHPHYKKLSRTKGTPEHFLAQNPFYLRVVSEQLADVNDPRAMALLWDCVELFAQAQSVNTLTRYNVEAAWLVLADSQMPRGEALIKLMLAGASTHPVGLFIDHMQPEPPDTLYPPVGDKPGSDLLVRLAKLPDTYSRPNIGLRTIELIAQNRQWAMNAEDAGPYLKHDDPRVRLAAASLLYIQNAYDQSRPAEDQPENKDATRDARTALEGVWQGLLKERQALHTADPLEMKGSVFTQQRKLKHNKLLLDHLVQLTAFLTLDTHFTDLCIQTTPYSSSASTWLARSAVAGQVELAAGQLERLTGHLSDPWASDEASYAIAEALIRMDHRPAAPAILAQLNAMRVLNGYELHPQVVVGNSPQFPASYIAWLKKNTEPAQLHDHDGGGTPDH